MHFAGERRGGPRLHGRERAGPAAARLDAQARAAARHGAVPPRRAGDGGRREGGRVPDVQRAHAAEAKGEQLQGDTRLHQAADDDAPRRPTVAPRCAPRVRRPGIGKLLEASRCFLSHASPDATTLCFSRYHTQALELPALVLSRTQSPHMSPMLPHMPHPAVFPHIHLTNSLTHSLSHRHHLCFGSFLCEFRPPTHFSHMSHPTSPTSHL